MKKIIILLSIAAVALTACQQAPETVTVDIETETAALNELFDSFNAAGIAGDAATQASYLLEDGVYCGTDPSEFFTKQEITDMWTQMYAESGLDITFISERAVKVAPDGNSAVVVDQYMFPVYTPKIPWRNVYHLIKTDDKWMILFFSAAFVPKNEDIPKLNAAME